MDDQPWSYPEYPTAEDIELDELSEEQHQGFSAAVNATLDEGSDPYVWYPEASWGISNPPSVLHPPSLPTAVMARNIYQSTANQETSRRQEAFHHPSMEVQSQMEAMPQESDQMGTFQHVSSNSSEYGSIYSPAFEDRPSLITQPHLRYGSGSGDLDVDVGMAVGDMATSGSSSSTPLLLDQRRHQHHHFMRGRSAESASRDIAERRRNQNRASQRAFRQRKEERIKELEKQVAEQETQMRELEERNRMLEARNAEVEGWNRDLVARLAALGEEGS